MSEYTAEQVAREADLQEDHVADMLRDYAALLRERESAKAKAFVPPSNCRQRLKREGRPYPRSSCQACGKWCPRNQDCETLLDASAINPIFASARVPDETGWLIESTFGASSPSWWTGIPEGCGQSFTTDANKAVRFCRKGDAEAVAKHMRRVIVTEHKWLAAAPKPTNVWPVDAREKAFSLAREMLQKGSAKPETEE